MTHTPTAPRVTSHTPCRDIPTGSSRPLAGRRRGGGDTRSSFRLLAVGRVPHIPLIESIRTLGLS